MQMKMEIMGNLQMCHHGRGLVLVCSPSVFRGWTLEEFCDYGNIFYKVPTLPPNSGQIISPKHVWIQKESRKNTDKCTAACVPECQTISQLSLEEIFVTFNVFHLKTYLLKNCLYIKFISFKNKAQLKIIFFINAFTADEEWDIEQHRQTYSILENHSVLVNYTC